MCSFKWCNKSKYREHSRQTILKIMRFKKVYITRLSCTKSCLKYYMRKLCNISCTCRALVTIRHTQFRHKCICMCICTRQQIYLLCMTEFVFKSNYMCMLWKNLRKLWYAEVQLIDKTRWIGHLRQLTAKQFFGRELESIDHSRILF